MALMKRPGCGAPAKDTASACPGYDRKSNGCIRRLELFLPLLVFAGAIAWLWFSQLHEKQPVDVETRRYIAAHSVVLHDEVDVQVLDGRYRHYRVKLKGTAGVTVEFAVKHGPAIDVFFFDTMNFNQWEQSFDQYAAEEYKYMAELSSPGVSKGTKSSTIEAGTYYVVLDNTKLGPTRPPDNFKNDIATLDLKISRTSYK